MECLQPDLVSEAVNVIVSAQLMPVAVIIDDNLNNHLTQPGSKGIPERAKKRKDTAATTLEGLLNVLEEDWYKAVSLHYSI